MTNMWASGMWGWGFLWMALFWGLLITGIVWLVRAATGRPDRPDGAQAARRVLDERLARGEISPDEYTERRNILGNSR